MEGFRLAISITLFTIGTGLLVASLYLIFVENSIVVIKAIQQPVYTRRLKNVTETAVTNLFTTFSGICFFILSGLVYESALRVLPF